MNKFSRKNILITVGAVAVLVLLLIAFWPSSVPVQAVRIERGEVRVEVVEEARTRMHEVYVLSAPLSGKVLRVAVEPGDRVRAGEPLARLTSAASAFLDPRSDDETRALVAAAEARERASAADLEFAERELQRIRRLHAEGMIAESVRDAAEARVRTARAAEQVAVAELRRARAQLLAAGREGSTDAVLIKAPVDGVVLKVLQESESVLAAGTPLLVVGDPSRIEIVAELLSQDAVRVAVGAEALIDNWGGEALPAKVRRIEPAARTKVSALGIEEQRTNVILEFDEVPPPALRGHEFRVDARIVTGWLAETPRIPLSALVREGQDWVVYVVKSGKAQRRVVQVQLLGERYAALAPATEGGSVEGSVEVGQELVLYPSKKVAAGARVAVIQPQAAR